MTLAQKVLKKLLDKPIKPYPPVIENMEDWPIYILSQDRKKFIEEIDDFTVARLEKQHPNLQNLLAQTVYQERIRIKETPWKVDPPNDSNFWNKIRSGLLKTEEIKNKAQALDNNRSLLRKIIHRYSEEIVGTFSIPTFRFARWFLTVFFNRLLNAAVEKWWRMFGSRYHIHERIQVYGEVDAVRELFNKGVVIIVPTHFSNLDSILIGYAMDHIMGLPSFSYGAGLNLYNSGIAAFFMNRLGAYRVDRRKKNDIYLETLKAMSNLSIQRGTNSLFFPGGTRSRSGIVENKLKMGLMGTVIEAQRSLCQKGENKKIFIVPLVLSYHFVLEAPFLIHQHLQITGKEKYLKSKSDGNSIREWVKFAWQVFSKKSDIVLSFGKPMDVLGNFVNTEGLSFDKNNQIVQIEDYFKTEDAKHPESYINEDLQREAEYTKMLADRIVERFHRENIVLSSHLVAFTAFNILKHQNDNLDLYALLRLPPDDYVCPIGVFEDAIREVQLVLWDMAEKGRIKISEAINLPVKELVEDGLKNLGVYHIRKPLTFNKEGDIESDDFSVLFYYHNRLENFGLTKRIDWDKYKMIVRT